MDDKSIIDDILQNEKYITTNMAYALNEASCDYLYKKYFSMFTDVSEITKNLFYLAYNNGWYKLEDANADKISTSKTKIEDDLENCN